MTVTQLINQLKTMPQGAAVIVRGYEDGVNIADRVAQCKIIPFQLEKEYLDEYGDIPWYYGRYERSKGDGEQAVFIYSLEDGAQDNGRNEIDALEKSAEEYAKRLKTDPELQRKHEELKSIIFD